MVRTDGHRTIANPPAEGQDDCPSLLEGMEPLVMEARNLSTLLAQIQHAQGIEGAVITMHVFDPESERTTEIEVPEALAQQAQGSLAKIADIHKARLGELADEALIIAQAHA